MPGLFFRRIFDHLTTFCVWVCAHFFTSHSGIMNLLVCQGQVKDPENSESSELWHSDLLFLIYLYVMKSWISSLSRSVIWTCRTHPVFGAAKQASGVILLQLPDKEIMQIQFLLIGCFYSNVHTHTSMYAHISLKRVKKKKKTVSLVSSLEAATSGSC